ncbi:MAG: hypothetical protein HKM95_16400 [Inquilinus sp.]|nr:hypothetical protein [Inquilinus sp.]
MASRAGRSAWLALVGALLATGCGSGTSLDRPSLPANDDGLVAFDRAASEAILTGSRATPDAVDPIEAERNYRLAAFSWPDHREAWVALSDIARARGDGADEAAARFIIDRLDLYPSDELYVQRQVNAALKTFLDEQRALTDNNPTMIAYGERLAAFYDAQLAANPAYVPPTGIFNLAPYELPTALITGGAGYVYFSTLGAE